MTSSRRSSFVLSIEQPSERLKITLQEVRSRERLELASWEELVEALQRSLEELGGSSGAGGGKEEPER